MGLRLPEFWAASRLRAVVDEFSFIKDPRQSHPVAYPLAELLLLAVCGTIVDCDDFDAIASLGKPISTFYGACGLSTMVCLVGGGSPS